MTSANAADILGGGSVYEFYGKGSGALVLPLNTYAFRYTVADGVLTLDFKQTRRIAIPSKE